MIPWRRSQSGSLRVRTTNALNPPTLVPTPISLASSHSLPPPPLSLPCHPHNPRPSHPCTPASSIPLHSPSIRLAVSLRLLPAHMYSCSSVYQKHMLPVFSTHIHNHTRITTSTSTPAAPLHHLIWPYLACLRSGDLGLCAESAGWTNSREEFIGRLEGDEEYEFRPPGELLDHFSVGNSQYEVYHVSVVPATVAEISVYMICRPICKKGAPFSSLSSPASPAGLK